MVTHFTEAELNHLFIALLLHTKMTRAEQEEWVRVRATIWTKILETSSVPPTEETTYRATLFNSSELLRKFWKDPDQIEKAFTLSKVQKAKTKKAGR